MSTKTGSVLQSSASNSAGSTTTSSTLSLTTSNGAGITAKVTNGATGPTIGCTVTVNVSQDSGSTWQFYENQTAGTSNSGVYPMSFNLPAPWMAAQVVFTGNTGQAVTVEAQAHSLGAIS